MNRDYPRLDAALYCEPDNLPLQPDSMNSKHIDLLDFSELPSAVYFRYADFNTHEYAAPHRHPWGTLEYAAHGVLHMDVDGNRFMSPPQYAVWVPPQTEHSFYSHQPVNYRAVCLDPKVCTDLPERACTLAISDILKAILKDFAARDVKIPNSTPTSVWPRCWSINCNRRRSMNVICRTRAIPGCWRFSMHCRPIPAITSRWRTGRRRYTSASARWPGSSCASWA